MKSYKGLSLVLDKYIWAAASFIYLFFLARSLGTELFSIYSFYLSIALLLGFINFNYLITIFTKKIIEEINCQEKIFYSRIIFSFYLLIIAMIIFSIFPDIIFESHFYEYKNVIYILVLGVFFQSFNTFESYFHSNLNVEKVSVYKSIAILLSLLVKVTLINRYPTITTAACLFILELLFINTISIWLYYSSKKRLKIDNDIGFDGIFKAHTYFLRIISDNWPLLLSFVAITFYAKIDQYMIGMLYFDKSSVGVLAIINRFIDGLVISISIVGIIYFPKLVRSYGTSVYKYTLRRYIYMSMFVSLLLSIVFVIMVNIALSVILDFNVSLSVVLIYGGTVFFNCFSIAVGRVLIVENLLSITLYRNLFALSFNVVLNYILIPDFGVFGAGLASFISWFISGFLFLALSSKTSHILKVTYK